MTEPSPAIRRAHPEDASALTTLALRSKAHWGYPRDFMEACRAELTYDRDYLAAHTVFVLESEGRLIGFHSLERLSDQELEMGALFVDPGEIGKGYGRLLVEHALQVAGDLGATTVVIEGDPHARGFYLAMGATLAGEAESGSIPGRMLPVFHLPVTGTVR